jgi:hypothetical protein
VTDPSQGAAARARRASKVLRLVLLVVVVIGAFAGWQVVQREFLPRTYEVSLLVVGDDIGDTIWAADVLEHFEVIVEAPGLEVEPVRLSDAGARGSFTLHGTKRYGSIEQAGMNAALIARGDSPRPLRVELGRFTPDAGSEIIVQLTPADYARLRREPVRASFEVIDETGRPLAGISSGTAGMSELGNGRYQIEVQFDQVLIELRLETPLQVRVQGVENLRTLAIEPRWFLGEPREARMVQVDLGKAERVRVPVIEAVTPARIARSARGGNIVVSGEDLLLVASARLVRGTTKLRLVPTRQREGNIEFELPVGLENGRWSIELDVDGLPEPMRVDPAIEVYTEFRLDAPAPLAQIPFGAPVEVQWSAAGAAGTVKVEIENAAASVRWPVYEGSVGQEAARFPAIGSTQTEAPLAPGTYRLVLVLPRELGGERITREFTVLEPPAVEVIVQFTRNGRPFTAYDEVQVNGRSVELNPLRRSFKVELPAGRHDLAVKVNSIWQRLQFETSGQAGESVELSLDR